MGKLYDAITDRQRKWIAKQKLFFVATAPSGDNGHVNLSPKGLDTFKVIDGNTIAYLDLHGSGIETIAHIQQNNRVTIMMTAFDGPPMTLRFFGTGQALMRNTPEFDDIKEHFMNHIAARSIIKIDLSRIQDSCGWSIPLFEYKGDRDVYDKYCEKKGVEGMNISLSADRVSIDGIRVEK